MIYCVDYFAFNWWSFTIIPKFGNQTRLFQFLAHTKLVYRSLSQVLIISISNAISIFGTYQTRIRESLTTLRQFLAFLLRISGNEIFWASWKKRSHVVVKKRESVLSNSMAVYQNKCNKSKSIQIIKKKFWLQGYS